jgi:hypothetical protein
MTEHAAPQHQIWVHHERGAVWVECETCNERSPDLDGIPAAVRWELEHRGRSAWR